MSVEHLAFVPSFWLALTLLAPCLLLHHAIYLSSIEVHGQIQVHASDTRLLIDNCLDTGSGLRQFTGEGHVSKKQRLNLENQQDKSPNLLVS